MAIPTKKSDLYFRAAIGLSALGFVAFAGSVYFYWSHLHQGGISGRSDDWGSFGAYVSGIAGTVKDGALAQVRLAVELDPELMKRERISSDSIDSRAARSVVPPCPVVVTSEAGRSLVPGFHKRLATQRQNVATVRKVPQLPGLENDA